MDEDIKKLFAKALEKTESLQAAVLPIAFENYTNNQIIDFIQLCLTGEYESDSENLPKNADRKLIKKAFFEAIKAFNAILVSYSDIEDDTFLLMKDIRLQLMDYLMIERDILLEDEREFLEEVDSIYDTLNTIAGNGWVEIHNN